MGLPGRELLPQRYGIPWLLSRPCYCPRGREPFDFRPTDALTDISLPS